MWRTGRRKNLKMLLTFSKIIKRSCVSGNFCLWCSQHAASTYGAGYFGTYLYPTFGNILPNKLVNFSKFFWTNIVKFHFLKTRKSTVVTPFSVLKRMYFVSQTNAQCFSIIICIFSDDIYNRTQFWILMEIQKFRRLRRANNLLLTFS